jgi:hypothetical protein
MRDLIMDLPGQRWDARFENRIRGGLVALVKIGACGSKIPGNGISRVSVLGGLAGFRH